MDKRWAAIAVVVVLVLGVVTVGVVVFVFGDDDSSEPIDGLAFSEAAEEYGISHDHEDTPSYSGTQRFMSDAGVYVTDRTNNGNQDILLGEGGDVAMYENREGEFTEIDVIPAVDGTIRAAHFFDYDGDGLEDLLLLRMNDTPVLLENTGTDYVERDVGLDRHLDVPVAATAADYTGNGCLDLLIAQNGDWSNESPKGELEDDVPIDEDNGEPNVLFENDCSEFTDATDTAGLEGDRWTLAVSFVDLTGNGLPDIHEGNDYNHDILYKNQGDGTFEQVVMEDTSNRNAMSSAINDFVGNGHPDIFVTNIWLPDELRELDWLYALGPRTEGNNLFINDGEGNFEDKAPEYGVERGGWGWAAVTQDLNNNGNLDIVHTNRIYEINLRGGYSEMERSEFEDRYPFFRFAAVFEGMGDELREIDAEEAGFLPMDARGAAELDVNANGLLDIFIAERDDKFRLYENDAESKASIQVDVQRGDETPAIGSTVRVETTDDVQYRWYKGNSDYHSQGQRLVHVGLGEASSASLTVEWPDGTSHTFDDLDVDNRYTVSPDGEIDSTELGN